MTEESMKKIDDGGPAATIATEALEYAQKVADGEWFSLNDHCAGVVARALLEAEQRIAKQREEIERLRQLAGDVYQVVGALADAADVYETEQAAHVMDNLSAASRGDPIPHADILPFFAGEKLANARAELSSLRERLKAVEQKCIHPEYDYPGDAPEICCYSCQLCDAEGPTAENMPHHETCPFSLAALTQEVERGE